MKKIFLFNAIILIMVLLLISACKKDKKDNNNDIPLVFTELKADNDTIIGGTFTYVRATATGNNIRYQWVASAGDILGSGAEVQYAAPPCVIGNNQISCTVKDDNNNAITKTITIYGL